VRLVLKLFSALVLLYALFWVGLAVYFSYLDKQTPLFERQLGKLFGAQVSIEAIETRWDGFSPNLLVTGFNVDGELDEQSAFTFESLEAQLSPVSVLTFWPKFTKFSVQSPVVEVVTNDARDIKIAGIQLNRQSKTTNNPKRFLEWLLDQKHGTWANGEIVWRQQAGELRHYKGINFSYTRDDQLRTLLASFTGERGDVSFNAQATGDFLSDKHWDASLGAKVKSVRS